MSILSSTGTGLHSAIDMEYILCLGYKKDPNSSFYIKELYTEYEGMSYGYDVIRIVVSESKWEKDKYIVNSHRYSGLEICTKMGLKLFTDLETQRLKNQFDEDVFVSGMVEQINLEGKNYAKRYKK